MRLSRNGRRVFAVGVVAVLAAGTAVVMHLDEDKTTPATTPPAAAPAQSSALAAAAPVPSSAPPSQDPVDRERIEHARQHYGIHFDHPANEGVTMAQDFLPYTNVWADIQFKGQDNSGKFVPPVVKTYGNITVKVPAQPRKEVRSSPDVPGSTTTFYFWDVRVIYGDGVTDYMTLHDPYPSDDNLSNWSTLTSTPVGEQHQQEEALTTNAYLYENIVVTATDPSKTREGGTAGMPVSWKALATIGEHLPMKF